MGVSDDSSGCTCLGDAKVAELDGAARAAEHVGALEVAVDDALRITNPHRWP